MYWILFAILQFSNGGTLVASAERIERKIRVVCPDADTKTVLMMAEEIAGFRGTVPEDIIVSVAWVETRCTHLRKRGAAGEWGILQVIPYDGHIVRLAGDYRCSVEEAKEMVVVDGVRRPLCDVDKRLDVWRGGKVVPWRVEAMLKGNARAAFRVGIWELGEWKRQYEAVLFGKFWRKYPAWMEAKVPDPAGFRVWWYNVTAKLGPDAWVVHHNYGPRLVSGPGPRAYPFKVIQALEQVRGVK